MKKYIAQKGYKFKSDADDMIDKQFYLEASAYEASETSTLSNLVYDKQETYVLFLKAFDVDNFKSKLQSIINNANAAGLCSSLGNAVSVERQENGYMITMNFITRGE